MASQQDHVVPEDESSDLEAGAAPSTEPGVPAKGGPRPLPEIPVALPAVIHNQVDLSRVLAAHQAWIDAVLDPRVEVASGRANLTGADLRPYNLSGVNLSGATLCDANLSGVDLSLANLTVANLSGANLSAANLSGARLTRAKVAGADFRDADLTNAVVAGVDWSKALVRSANADLAPEGPEEVRIVGQADDAPSTDSP